MSEILTKLGVAVFLTERELASLVRSAPRRYKVYQIPKRTPGQFRTIAQPAREVKALQYWVMGNLLETFPIHSSAVGYRRGLNISDNARQHTKGSYLLKMDFLNFFPSLKARDFRLLVKRSRSGLDDDDLAALERILFWKPKGTNDLCLSIGAPTSPILSNVLMMEFDERVATFCEGLGVAYTRYADDLSFSADRAAKLRETEVMVTALCRELDSPRLTVNPEKTVRVSKRQARRVTGLVITNDQDVSLGREEKRTLRAAVHHCLAGRLSKDERLRLSGMLAYVNSVEPAFLERLRNRYGTAVVDQIRSV